MYLRYNQVKTFCCAAALASIHRPNSASGHAELTPLRLILAADMGAGFLPLTCPAACPGFALGGRDGGAGGRGESGGLVRTGQAAAGGGPQVAANRFIHWCSQCQPAGRCKVMWPQPCRAVRAATSMRSRRMVDLQYAGAGVADEPGGQAPEPVASRGG